jgi:hypothetical protein
MQINTTYRLGNDKMARIKESNIDEDVEKDL